MSQQVVVCDSEAVGAYPMPQNETEDSQEREPTVAEAWGETFRAARRERGVSRARLARTIGVSAYTLSAWERGEHMPQRRYREALRAEFPDLADPPASAREIPEAQMTVLRAVAGARRVGKTHAEIAREVLGGVSTQRAQQVVARAIEVGVLIREPDPEPVTWPEHLRYQRRRAGLSQAELGRRIGVGGQTVHSWESGRRDPKAESIEALRRVLPEVPEHPNPYSRAGVFLSGSTRGRAVAMLRDGASRREVRKALDITAQHLCAIVYWARRAGHLPRREGA